MLLQALKAAARQGQWTPDGSASCPVSLSILEQLLCLPTILFLPVLMFLRINPGAGSPVQVGHTSMNLLTPFTFIVVLRLGRLACAAEHDWDMGIGSTPGSRGEISSRNACGKESSRALGESCEVWGRSALNTAGAAACVHRRTIRKYSNLDLQRVVYFFGGFRCHYFGRLDQRTCPASRPIMSHVTLPAARCLQLVNCDGSQVFDSTSL